jgi:hypothetical protein
MHAAATPSPHILDALPDPENIRDRLTTLFVEARLLRRLLRVAIDAHQARAVSTTTGKEVQRHGR